MESSFAIYEEIASRSTAADGLRPIPILRPGLVSGDDFVLPRPKLGWPNRKVTFGKWKNFLLTMLASDGHLDHPLLWDSATAAGQHSGTFCMNRGSN